MWENRRRRNTIIKIILLIVAVGLAAVLVIGMKYVTAQANAQEQAISEVSSRKQDEQTAVKEESLEQISADYQADLDAIAQYMPGIVCWGDTLTAGSVSGVSYPQALQDLIKENIIDAYDFRGTLDYADNISRVNWDDYTVDIQVVNMGSGDETTDTILGRNGAVPFVAASSFTIPADTEAVQITLKSANGDEVAPLTAGNAGVNNVTIAGIEGPLSLSSETTLYSNNRKYYFTRLEAGEAVEIPAGTEIVTAASEMYSDYITVIYIGTYGGYSSVEELISQQKAIIEHQTGNKDRYIIVGLCYLPTVLNGGTAKNFEQYETAMQQEFGNHFVNVRKYLVTEAMTDAKLTATSNDKKQMSSGYVPDSLRASSGSKELNSTAYKLIGKLIYDRMTQLGYFDEITDELGIKLK